MSGKIKPFMLGKDNIQERPLSAKEYLKLGSPFTLAVNNSHLISIRRPALPIIFVPGIMASRLRNGKKSVWDPDSPKRLAWQYANLTPRERFNLLAKNKNDLDVISEGNFEAYPHATSRGWAGVMWGAYKNLIKELDRWSTPLKFLIDLPVYGFGYNWMKSNNSSGLTLKQYIDKVLANHNASHVILITHSMGGLVARSACKDYHAEEKVFGVVHGAQPSLGAVDAYRRMIAGETSSGWPESALAARVIGKNGRCITAVLANTVAGLELLPTEHYHLDAAKNASKAEDRQWLHLVEHHEGEEPKCIASLPTKTNGKVATYREIYQEEECYWRLLRQDWVISTEPDPYKAISENVMYAKKFHDTLDKGTPYTHPRTIQLYSAGGQTTFCEIVWYVEEITSLIKDVMAWKNNMTPTIWAQDFENKRKEPGVFVELILVSEGKTHAKTRPHEGALDRHAFAKGGLFATHLAAGGKIYRRRLLERGEVRGGFPRFFRGDSTVPEMSGQGLAPVISSWPEECQATLARESEGGKLATFLPNTAEHQGFYEDDAGLQSAAKAIHNMALAWIEEFGANPGKAFQCKLACLRGEAVQQKQPADEGSSLGVEGSARSKVASGPLRYFAPPTYSARAWAVMYSGGKGVTDFPPISATYSISGNIRLEGTRLYANATGRTGVMGAQNGPSIYFSADAVLEQDGKEIAKKPFARNSAGYYLPDQTVQQFIGECSFDLPDPVEGAQFHLMIQGTYVATFPGGKSLPMSLSGQPAKETIVISVINTP